MNTSHYHEQGIRPSLLERKMHDVCMHPSAFLNAIYAQQDVDNMNYFTAQDASACRSMLLIRIQICRGLQPNRATNLTRFPIANFVFATLERYFNFVWSTLKPARANNTPNFLAFLVQEELPYVWPSRIPSKHGHAKNNNNQIYPNMLDADEKDKMRRRMEKDEQLVWTSSSTEK